MKFSRSTTVGSCSTVMVFFLWITSCSAGLQDILLALKDEKDVNKLYEQIVTTITSLPSCFTALMVMTQSNTMTALTYYTVVELQLQS